MKKNIPVLFFALACLLNWAGKIWEPALANAVKPALMPLLALSVVVYALEHRLDKRILTLLVCAQLFGCVGDVLLLGEAFPLFAGGIGAFLIGHIFYISIFGEASFPGLKWPAWAAGILSIGVLVAGLVKLLHVSGALLPPMAVYGFALAMLMFSTFCGLVRRPEKKSWALLFAGAVLFTFSDSLIAAQNFGVLHFRLLDVSIMVTYLAAQSLLAWGSVRLAKR